MLLGSGRPCEGCRRGATLFRPTNLQPSFLRSVHAPYCGKRSSGFFFSIRFLFIDSAAYGALRLQGASGTSRNMRFNKWRWFFVYSALLLTLALVGGCTQRHGRAMVMVPANVLNEPPPRQAQAMWQQGEQQLAAGKRNDAIVTFEHLAQAYPANAIACRAWAGWARFISTKANPAKRSAITNTCSAHIPSGKMPTTPRWTCCARSGQMATRNRSSVRPQQSISVCSRPMPSWPFVFLLPTATARNTTWKQLSTG